MGWRIIASKLHQLHLGPKHTHTLQRLQTRTSAHIYPHLNAPTRAYNVAGPHRLSLSYLLLCIGHYSNAAVSIWKPLEAHGHRRQLLESRSSVGLNDELNPAPANGMTN
jgi:hypothetical protein